MSGNNSSANNSSSFSLQPPRLLDRSSSLASVSRRHRGSRSLDSSVVLAVSPSLHMPATPTPVDPAVLAAARELGLFQRHRHIPPTSPPLPPQVPVALQPTRSNSVVRVQDGEAPLLASGRPRLMPTVAKRQPPQPPPQPRVRLIDSSSDQGGRDFSLGPSIRGPNSPQTPPKQTAQPGDVDAQEARSPNTFSAASTYPAPGPVNGCHHPHTSSAANPLTVSGIDTRDGPDLETTGVFTDVRLLNNNNHLTVDSVAMSSAATTVTATHTRLSMAGSGRDDDGDVSCFSVLLGDEVGEKASVKSSMSTHIPRDARSLTDAYDDPDSHSHAPSARLQASSSSTTTTTTATATGSGASAHSARHDHMMIRPRVVRGSPRV